MAEGTESATLLSPADADMMMSLVIITGAACGQRKIKQLHPPSAAN